MSHSETQAVRTEVVGKAGLIILNNPPVNALGLKLREGIVDALSELNGDANVEAIVIYGEGKAISAGAGVSGRVLPEWGRGPGLVTGKRVRYRADRLPDAANGRQNAL